MEKLPRLRPLEIYPIKTENGYNILIQDPFAYIEEPMIFSGIDPAILSFFDGDHTMADIKLYLARREGRIVFTEEIEKLINYMDAYLLLDTPHFEEEKKRIEENFRNQKKRFPFHAGRGYPKEKDELSKMISSFFKDASKEKKLSNSFARALFGPHLDIKESGISIAKPYLYVEKKPELFIILGTGHTVKENFAFTYKDFETPLGIGKTKKKIVDHFKNKFGDKIFKDEYQHKKEHSIEFHLLFLNYLFGDVEIIPILCGQVDRGQLFVDVVGLLSEIFEKSDSVTLAAVDFSHVGIRYGDKNPPSLKDLIDVEEQDRRYLKYLQEIDAEGFLDEVEKTDNRTRVCGVSALYALCKICRNLFKGILLDYRKWNDPSSTSVVTYASMIYL